ncbi:MAG: ubiquinol-cytochrome c reductase iron-sulfur subunit [Spirochaetia bacterium]|nr:ubiquinol-cytochrome c reductase iron-sulfur subunit [Spirochaetia bacterium]
MEEKQNKTTRKDFLKKLTGYTILGGVIGHTWMYVRSTVPNVLYEPLRRFKIGSPDKYTDGITYLAEERLYIIKEKNEYECVSAVCTHLGCTVNVHQLGSSKEITLPDGKKLKQKWEYHCPCHGSKYRGDGTIYTGPAPENLPRFTLSVSPDNQLVVDRNKKVKKDFRLKV